MTNKVNYHFASGTYLDATAITPNDTVDLPKPISGFCVTVAGDVRIETPAGSDVTITCSAVGVIYPIAAVKVFATSTTATGIVGVH